MPMLPLPTILMDLPPYEGDTIGVKMWTVRPTDTDAVANEAAKRHPGAKKVTIYGEFNSGFFMRMLAKIAHAFAIAEYGYGSFPPLLPPLILGTYPNFRYNHVVGGLMEQTPKWPGPMCVGRLIRAGSMHYCLEYLVAELRIFADLGAPIYYVVCGFSGGLGLPLRVQQGSP